MTTLGLSRKCNIKGCEADAAFSLAHVLFPKGDDVRYAVSKNRMAISAVSLVSCAVHSGKLAADMANLGEDFWEMTEAAFVQCGRSAPDRNTVMVMLIPLEASGKMPSDWIDRVRRDVKAKFGK